MNCELYNGLLMPSLGFGTWQSTDIELEKALDAALEAGYRHIDTAYVYENEHIIGRVLKKWLDSGKVKREELFIVTKLPTNGNRPSGVEKFLNKSLEALCIDYVDVYLIHVPWTLMEVEGDNHPMKDGKLLLDTSTDHVATWKEMEKQVDAGKAKAIGVSNFNISQIQRVIDNARIKPAVLQVELHAYHQQKPLVEFCKKNGMVVTAYSPLGSPGLAKFVEQFGQKVTLPDILNNPIAVDIGKKHNKSAAQVLLRHAMQKGLVVIPKSVNPERLKQNFNVFNFSLSDDEMKQLNDLDQGENGRIIDFTVFPGLTEHPEYPFKHIL